MRRDQLEHAIRTACQIIERPEVIVVGSQAILGSFREDELPAEQPGRRIATSLQLCWRQDSREPGFHRVVRFVHWVGHGSVLDMQEARCPQ